MYSRNELQRFEKDVGESPWSWKELRLCDHHWVDTDSIKGSMDLVGASTKFTEATNFCSVHVCTLVCGAIPCVSDTETASSLPTEELAELWSHGYDDFHRDDMDTETNK